MPSEHRRVLRLLADCGTGRLGSVRYRCARCEEWHRTFASCGNRHCPGCQRNANGRWCAAQVQKLVPGESFFVTFTIPDSLRMFVRSHQSLCYDAIMKSAAYALQTAMANGKFCGAEQIGFTSVLHTFGRDLNYHPHVHVIIPAGGMSDGEWRATRPGFLVPVKVLSKLFRTRFEQLVGEQAAEHGIAATAFHAHFVSDSRAVGDGVSTLKYLSRYVFRTAITNRRIVSMSGGQVTFTYRKHGEHKDRRMRLPALEFLRRFLQHVLPRGFHKVRHYGFLSRRSKTDLQCVRSAILTSLAESEPDLELEPWEPPRLKSVANNSTLGPSCPACGGPLTFISYHRIRPPPRVRDRREPLAHR